MTDIREMATKFEAKKIALVHDKNGHVLRLAIHFEDTPDSLFHDPLGQRYVVALVRVDDDESPIESKADHDALRAVKMAAMLCSDKKFQGWLCTTGLADGWSEEEAAIAVRAFCGVGSRSELKSNKVARDKLFKLRDDFLASMTRR